MYAFEEGLKNWRGFADCVRVAVRKEGGDTEFLSRFLFCQIWGRCFVCWSNKKKVMTKIGKYCESKVAGRRGGGERIRGRM